MPFKKEGVRKIEKKLFSYKEASERDTRNQFNWLSGPDGNGLEQDFLR